MMRAVTLLRYLQATPHGDPIRSLCLRVLDYERLA